MPNDREDYTEMIYAALEGLLDDPIEYVVVKSTDFSRCQKCATLKDYSKAYTEFDKHENVILLAIVARKTLEEE